MLLDFVHLTEGQAQALHYALHVEKWEVSPDIGIPRVQIIDDDEDQEKACINKIGERSLCAVGFGRNCERNTELTSIIDAGCPKGKRIGCVYCIMNCVLNFK